MRMEQMINANIALDIAAIVLSLIPVIYLLNNHRYRERLNLFFLGVSISNIFMIIGDLADWVFQDTSLLYERVIVIAFTVVYYAASGFVLYFFACYMDEYLHLSGRTRKIYITSITAVCCIQVFFALISPFTGAIFYVENNGYQRGRLFMISQLVPLFCYISFTVLIILHRKKLRVQEIVFFLLYVFVPLGGGAAQMFMRGIAVVNISVAIALILIVVQIQIENEIRLNQKEKELAEMRIDIMLSQIQPHFLYNVLTCIRYLCETDPSQAADSIGIFSRFLRTNMDSLTNKRPIPFEKELSHTKAYLELEHRRFGNKLRVVYSIAAVDFSIPPLTLQPIAENAVRHGLMKKENGGTLTISSGETDDSFFITVADDGVGFSEEAIKNDDRTHIGITNVRNRLQTLCGGTVAIQSKPGTATVVTIKIPKEGEKN